VAQLLHEAPSQINNQIIVSWPILGIFCGDKPLESIISLLNLIMTCTNQIKYSARVLLRSQRFLLILCDSVWCSWTWSLIYYDQGRIQGRRQPATGHPLGSLKNKGRMVKNKFFFIRIFYLFEPGTPIDRFWLRPWLWSLISSSCSFLFLFSLRTIYAIHTRTN
jgi:hypothetical protein